MNRYPPLKALLVFDAVMRTHSFSSAAEELCVTPGAVGQQIQKLEKWLGMPLFIRQVRQVQSTAEARDYWQSIQPALAQIADASNKLRDSRSMAVSLSMPPSYAAKWFTRRMARLLARHPQIELHLKASAVVVDFERESIDLAIRYFDGQSPHLDATLLFKDEAHVYCSPGYAKALCLNIPEDLGRATWLVTAIQPFWRQWFKTFSQLDDSEMTAIPRIHFDQALMAIEAAKLGQGVVMTSPLLTEGELAEGTLIELFKGYYLPLTDGYYVVHHSKLFLRPAGRLVKQWLIDEAHQ